MGQLLLMVSLKCYYLKITILYDYSLKCQLLFFILIGNQTSTNITTLEANTVNVGETSSSDLTCFLLSDQPVVINSKLKIFLCENKNYYSLY